VIDAAVNGGVEKYKEAFCTTEYLESAAEAEQAFVPMLIAVLQEQVSSSKSVNSIKFRQVDVLARSLEVHKKYCPENMNKLHSQLESELFFF
jgi:hypothetical protein